MCAPPPDESVATPVAPKNEDPRTVIAVSGRTLNNRRYADDIVIIASPIRQQKVKLHTLDIAPLRNESPPQKRTGMARVLKGFHSFTCTPTRSSAIGMSHTCLPFQPQPVLIYRPRFRRRRHRAGGGTCPPNF